MNIGQRVYRLRRQRHWSRLTMQHESGVHALTILSIEHSRQRPRYTTLEQIAAAFDMTTSELLKGVSDE